jgi:hypothetical protein
MLDKAHEIAPANPVFRKILVESYICVQLERQLARISTATDVVNPVIQTILTLRLNRPVPPPPSHTLRTDACAAGSDGQIAAALADSLT